MKVDNFLDIRGLMSFEDENDFYVVSIIKRRKENPYMTTNSSVLKEYHIFSHEEFDGLKNKMIGSVNINNARAYINLNKRNAEKLSIDVIKKVAELIKSQEYRAIKNAYSSVVGKSPKKKEYWVIDFDETKIGDKSIDEMVNFINDELRPNNVDSKVMFTLPTVSGVHLITKPFDLKEYLVKYPDLTVYKDAPTLLFA